MKRRYLLNIFLFALFFSCKKESAPSPAVVSLVGKWFITSQNSILYNTSGVQIRTFSNTVFNTSDFVQYLKDGSGYYSVGTINSPSLSEFTYKLSGDSLTEFSSIDNKGIPKTITRLTVNSLAIHVQMRVPDPNDPTITDNETDDYTYKR